MTNARSIQEPKFQLHRTSNCIFVKRDSYLFRIHPRDLQFQVDYMESDSFQLEEYRKQIKNSSFQKRVFGVFGYIKLAQLGYLILIEEATLVGQIMKANIYKVEKLMFLPIGNNASQVIPPEDQTFVNMFLQIQKEKAFYFSYDIDLTKNVQQIMLEIEEDSTETNNFLMMKQNFPNSVSYIPHFAFNDNILSEFHGTEYAPFKVPCIFGYVFISSPTINRSKIDFNLVSRKDCRRPGRRFVTRGLDREGNAANFVETEHIIVQHDSQQKLKIASFLQIRGSIPLLWTMKPNMKWSPPVKINPNFEDSRIAADIHFKETCDVYGPQYLVNLIDKKGSQKRIGDQFTKLHTTLKNKQLQYTWFDFHGECKKMKWENLSKLVDICKEELTEYGFFMAQMGNGMNIKEKLYQPKNIQIIQLQKGVFRTNCMDCLDRTNVVQGVYSRFIAHHQLCKLNLVDLPRNNSKLSAFEKFPPQLEEVFRHGWTNNADVLSYLYTGTPALKTDFTRTGKRTQKGAMNDGINAVTRYYINNFTDGYYHDCLDVATLKLLPNQYLRPRSHITPLKICLLLLVFMVYMAREQSQNMIAVDEEWGQKHLIMHICTIFATFLLGSYLIMTNGRKFVDDSSRYV